MSIKGFLELHVVVIGVFLLLMAWLLIKRHLFCWTSFGFWAWLAFTLYFFLHPAFSLISNDLSRYDTYLDVSGGYWRGLWILSMIVIGIMIYYMVYLKVTMKTVRWQLKQSNQISPIQTGILIFFVLIGLYSLVVFRSNLISTADILVIEGGRFTGEITGYQYSAYMLLFIPIFFLLLSNSYKLRIIGWGLFAVFIILALPYGWSRYTIVSIIIALSIADTLRKERAWPRIILGGAIVLSAAILQLRGHTDWSLGKIGGEVLALGEQLPTKVSGVITGTDTAMLPTFYLESYTKDQLSGYDYGIPLINYILTGWIPNRNFPQKYFLTDWLRGRQWKSGSDLIDDMLYGKKSSLIGSFYSDGGWVGVVILMGLMGFLTRKMDGMLANDSPQIVKAVGVSWLCVMWMVWGSHDYWGFMTLGFLTAPGLAYWLVSPKLSRKHAKQEQMRPVNIPVKG